ncbi:YfhD family protein [Priestia flexa]|jgi:YfhD-like protein|uniref:YfhD family protein n=2 Tax=Priestia flexa TaxID=86664 RepID=A0ABU4J421_9BACI|nr:YfhD family protein [Priestia flexa]MCA0968070.1 YfhD family protein [Priestia flexa]MCA1204065.1 YfhD family protein [Priestia flexa]MCG7313381.1 YfhD family protein [Priestia flexa]MCM3066712.1 YfhD family protein [Priestia flexa]MCP1189920.1 YfhD family protein [Priestia flexa]
MMNQKSRVEAEKAKYFSSQIVKKPGHSDGVYEEFSSELDQADLKAQERAKAADERQSH